jgi:hypothetical protein
MKLSGIDGDRYASGFVERARQCTLRAAPQQSIVRAREVS